MTHPSSRCGARRQDRCRNMQTKPWDAKRELMRDKSAWQRNCVPTCANASSRHAPASLRNRPKSPKPNLKARAGPKGWGKKIRLHSNRSLRSQHSGINESHHSAAIVMRGLKSAISPKLVGSHQTEVTWTGSKSSAAIRFEAQSLSRAQRTPHCP
jgi:hypothetical protein